jgi:catechol 2,3-dioxygenase-like lactoylglutathione lyase family enzyme
MFEDVMGMKVGPRPPFPFPGVWLYGEGEQAMVHAVSDPSLSAATGEMRMGHLAFRSDEPASRVLERVKRSGLPHKVAVVPQADIAQIFVLLPGGIVIELNVPNDQANTDHTYSADQAAPDARHF